LVPQLIDPRLKEPAPSYLKFISNLSFDKGGKAFDISLLEMEKRN